MAVELRKIRADYRRFDPWGYTNIERRLHRQRAILANLPVFPGYTRTRRACFDLAVEIEDLVHELEVALGRHISVTLRQIFHELLGLVRKVALPTLTRGVGPWTYD